MTTDPTLHLLEGLPMTTRPEARWPELDLTEFHDADEGDVKVVDTFAEIYTPSTEPEPVARLRHRQTWAERHRQDVDDLRLTIGQAGVNLRDAADGCKAVHYHPEVADQVAAALDRVTEALRLIDIYDPEP